MLTTTVNRCCKRKIEDLVHEVDSNMSENKYQGMKNEKYFYDES